MNNASKLTSFQFTLNCHKEGCYQQGIRLIIALAFICGVSCFNISSQTTDTVHQKGSWMISFGNGLSYAGDGDQSKAGWGLTVRTALDYEFKGLVVSAGVARIAGGTAKYDEWYLDNNSSNSLILDKHDLFFDYGLMIGGAIKLNNRLCLKAMTGISAVMGKRIVVTKTTGFLSDEVYHIERKSFDPCVGMPFEMNLQYHFIDALGVGLCAHANLNSEEDFYGIMINLILYLNKKEKYN
jgi:hypothetical protein